MSKHTQIISLIVMAIIILASGFGLAAYVQPGQSWGFNYYTVLSNAVCFIYFLCAFIYGIRRLNPGNDQMVWRPRLLGLVTFVITVTFLIYTFLLAPADIAAGQFWNLHNISVHYIVPLMTLIYWLVFCPKGTLKKWDPIAWLAVPAAYFCYILIRAQLVGNIGPLGTPYPYGFINIQKYGWDHVSKNVLIIMIGLVLLGYLFYSVDRALSKRARR